MPLGRLIGLEILKLHEEGDTLNTNISSYQTILSDRSELHRVIKAQLKEFRKKFAAPRKTELENIEQSDYVVEEKIEDIYILIDKFGYTKSVDAASFGRSAEESKKEFAHIVRMKSNDRLCVFTMQGTM